MRYLVVAFFSIGAVCCSQPQSLEQALMPISYADINIGGELEVRAMKNFDRLETDIYTPENVFPVKHETISADWPGDYEGRIILGLTLQAQATHRTPKYLYELIRLIPQKLNEEGYLGPVLKDSIIEQQLSGHGWFLRALCEYYEWKKDPAVKGYITSIINNLALPTKGYHKIYPIDPESRNKTTGEAIGTTQSSIGKWKLSSDIGCDFIFMDGVIQAYTIVPSPELKDLIDEMADRFLQMDLVAISAQTHATLTGLRGLLRYYGITKTPQLLHEVESRYLLYRSLAMTENYENYNWFGRPEWTEPCAIVDAFMVATQLWMFTGKQDYLEDAHHIYYNALAHTQRSNGGFGLDNCTRPGEPFLKVTADEAYWCCTMRGGEGMAKAIQYNYFTQGNGLYIPFFNNSSATFAFDNDKVVIKQTSSYPFDGNVSLTVDSGETQKPVNLALFAPSWANNFSIAINGEPIPFNQSDGFIQLKIELSKGMVIAYAFDMRTEIKELVHSSEERGVSGCKVMYGPLLLGNETGNTASFDKTAEFTRESEKSWKVKGTDIRLTPVFHLLSPNVTKESGYSSQVIFNMPGQQ